jgi:hypothetical protein
MPTSAYGPDVNIILRHAGIPDRSLVSVDGRDVEVECPFASPADWRAAPCKSGRAACGSALETKWSVGCSPPPAGCATTSSGGW